MGYWIIQIEGWGPHLDANNVAERTGKLLRDAGHRIEAVRFYSASAPKRLDPDRPQAKEELPHDPPPAKT